jgi:hypothetical protein
VSYLVISDEQVGEEVEAAAPAFMSDNSGNRGLDLELGRQTCALRASS